MAQPRNGAQPQSGYVHEDRRTVAQDGAGFDRVAFVMRALRILRPRGMTVAVHEGCWDLKIERGRHWGRGPNDTWAVISVPRDASRQHLAVALAQLAGVAQDPFVIDMLITAADQD